MPNGEIRHRRAAVVQEGPRGREPVAARAVAGPDGDVRFDVGAYDPHRPLVIDPVNEYRDTMASGTGVVYGEAIAVDAAGSAYVTGVTIGRITTTPGAYDESPNDIRNVFVTKLDPTGSSLVYATYLGGSSDDEGYGIAVDATGAAYVTGWSDSPDFPTTEGAFDPSPNDYEDAFVAKLSPDGGAIVYSTMLGTGNRDYGYGIAVDAAGHAVVLGETQGLDFPTTPGAFDTSFEGNGFSPIFVAKVAPDGASLDFSTFFGGSGMDRIRGDVGTGMLAIDATGAVYVAGQTTSIDFPTTPGAYDETIAEGEAPTFVSKLSPDGASLVYSTFVAGSAARAIAVDAVGSAYVAGLAGETLPTTPGAYDGSYGGETDGFVTKLTPDGSALAYSTYLGGADRDEVVGIAVDAGGRAHVAGHTRSPDFGAAPSILGDVGDLFVTTLSADGTARDYPTMLPSYGAAIAVDATGGVYVTGTSRSTEFPASPRAFSSAAPGFSPFVAKVTHSDSGPAYATFLSRAGDDVGHAIAVDATGAAYVLARTTSMLYPMLDGALDTRFGGGSEVIVTKLAPGATAVLYSTFLGGDGLDDPGDIAVNAAGEAYLTGRTSSADFPTTEGAYDRTVVSFDAFVTKLSADGASLVFSTFLGGSGGDMGTAIALRPNGAIFVAGRTSSPDFPTTPGGYDTTQSDDAFVVKLSPDGARLKRATFFGDLRIEQAEGIAVDRTGVTIVGAHTTPESGDDPALRSAFVAKFNKKLTGLVFSRVLATGFSDISRAVATDASGAIYVAGTTSTDAATPLVTTPGAFDTTANGESEAFVVKLSPSDGTTIYGTLLGGASFDGATAIAVDSAGRAYVVGLTVSTDFPVTADALDAELGNADAFVTVLAPDGASLEYSTFLGGSLYESAFGVALDSSGGIYVTGATGSPDFSLVQFGLIVESDLFVVKLRR
jgi:hypothetical protein